MIELVLPTYGKTLGLSSVLVTVLSSECISQRPNLGHGSECVFFVYQGCCRSSCKAANEMEQEAPVQPLSTAGDSFGLMEPLIIEQLVSPFQVESP